jgi:hypothetical protein
MDEEAVRAALQHYFDYSATDEDVAHEIYHEDAVLEFPQSGERFEGVENFREWRRIYPAKVDFEIRRVRAGTTSGWWSSCSATTAGCGSTASTSSSSGATRCPASRFSPWRPGRLRSGGPGGGLRRPVIRTASPRAIRRRTLAMPAGAVTRPPARPRPAIPRWHLRERVQPDRKAGSGRR